jgi:hypothetical protein
MKNKLNLPTSNWGGLESGLLRLRLSASQTFAPNDAVFLLQLGLLDESGKLTGLGLKYCDLVHIRRDDSAVAEILHEALAQLPATQLVLQSLWGLKDITVEQARMSLVFGGIEEGDVDQRLTGFLNILNANKILVYDRRNRQIRFLISPKESEKVPKHIYIDRARPFSNDVRIREILRACRGSILWLDKYFQKEAFEWIWREADASNISTVRIVSCASPTGPDVQAVADYKKLKKSFL